METDDEYRLRLAGIATLPAHCLALSYPGNPDIVAAIGRHLGVPRIEAEGGRVSGVQSGTTTFDPKLTTAAGGSGGAALTNIVVASGGGEASGNPSYPPGDSMFVAKPPDPFGDAVRTAQERPEEPAPTYKPDDFTERGFDADAAWRRAMGLP